MRLKESIRSWGDWLGGGSTTAIAMRVAGRFAVVGGPIIGGLWLAMDYVNRETHREYLNAFAALDRSQVVTFNSEEQCVAKGYGLDRCRQAIATAISWSEKSSTEIQYASPDTCADAFGSNACTEKTTTGFVTQSFPIVAGDGIVIPVITQMPYTTVSYKPIVIAVAADARDLGNAVPLYPTKQQGIAIRYDGAAYNLGG